MELHTIGIDLGKTVLSAEAHFSSDCHLGKLGGQADAAKQVVEAGIRAEVINP
jgi:hypothetical protein